MNNYQPFSLLFLVWFKSDHKKTSSNGHLKEKELYLSRGSKVSAPSNIAGTNTKTTARTYAYTKISVAELLTHAMSNNLFATLTGPT